jgi:hypothetical protein
VEFRATASYPYVDRDRAVSGLRGQLREIIARASVGVPNWSSLVVEGPVENPGLFDRTLLRLNTQPCRRSPRQAARKGLARAACPLAAHLETLPDP